MHGKSWEVREGDALGGPTRCVGDVRREERREEARAVRWGGVRVQVREELLKKQCVGRAGKLRG